MDGTQRIMVLLVDDDESHIELGQRAFEACSGQMELAVARSLAEARAFLADATPDLVIADLRLPDGDGTELLRNDGQSGRFPVVILTGQGDERAAVDVMKAGALDYVVKTPAAFDGLPDTAHRAVRQWRERIGRKRAEQRFRSLLEFAPDAMVIADADGIIQLINTQAEALFGYPRSELVGQSVDQLVPPAYRPKHVERRQHFYAAPKLRPMGRGTDLWGLRKDGTVIPVEISLSPIQMDEGLLTVAAIRDVTERKLAERALCESEETARVLMNAPDEVAVLTDREGRIERINEPLATLFGAEPRNLIGRCVWDFFPADVAEHRRRYHERVVQTKQPARFEDECDGHWFDTITHPIVDMHGEVTRVAALSRDITERKREQDALYELNVNLERAVQELKDTQKQVVQHERLRALGQMASGIAHDLNNSLSPVLGYSELAASVPDLPDNVREWLRFIQIGARDAAAVVERMREFYRHPETDLVSETLRLDELLVQIPELTRPKWKDEAERDGRTIQFRLKVKDRVTVRGNPSQLREVFTNLVFNAVDALPSGGRIQLGLRLSSELAIVEVADTGVGMTEDVASRCFEPFFTTKKSEGTGLGLSVCHGIVQRHGGRIEIDTRPGHGTKFRVSLPLADATAIRIPMRVKDPLPARRVLYIDDDVRLRQLASTLLDRLGQTVDFAESGAKGLEMFRSNQYDIVVTDLGMPEIDGREVTRIIKSLQPDVAVIMVTGWGPDVIPKQSDQESGPDEFVTKPLTESKLQIALENTLSRFAAGRG